MSQVNWVPDDKAHACFKCKTNFGFMTRKHHCRNCGGVFCNSCSDRRVTLKNSEGPVRVCVTCYLQLTTKQKAASIVTLGKSAIRLLYETRSICIHCSITEQKGFKFGHVLAYVLQHEEKVYLYTICSNHPHVPSITLLCSNATFYHYLMTFKQSFEYGYSIIDQFLGIPPLTPQQQATIRPHQMLYPNLLCLSSTSTALDQASHGDKETQDDPYTALSSLHTLPVHVISDAASTPKGTNTTPQQPQQVYGLDSKELFKRLLLPQQTPHLLPLIVEIELSYPDGMLRSDGDLISELSDILAFYPQGYGFLLKLNVGLAGSFTTNSFEVLTEVNNKVLQLHEWLERYFIEQELLHNTVISSPYDDDHQIIGSNNSSDEVKGLSGQLGGINLNTGTANTSANSSTFRQIKQQQQQQDAAASGSSSTGGTSGRGLHHNKITILVDSSLDRLVLLCEVANTIFLKSNVFPFLRYFLMYGDEQNCVTELNEAFAKLTGFSHMNVCIMLILESEGGVSLPDLRPVVQLLLQNTYLVRMVLFHQQRSVSTVVSRATDRYELITSLYEQAILDINDAEVLQSRLLQLYGPGWERQGLPLSQHSDQQLIVQNVQNLLKQYQQQAYQDKLAAIQSLKELGIDDQMISLISTYQEAQNVLQNELSTTQQQQAGIVNTTTTVTTADGQQVQVKVQTINTNNNNLTASIQPQTQGGAMNLPQPQQIRFAPSLLAKLTYKWLQSPLYFYQRQQQPGQAAQNNQRTGPGSPAAAGSQPSDQGAQRGPTLKDTHMETVDMIPLLNAINAAANGATPLQTWFPISASQPLSSLVSKRLRTNLLFNFNTDPLSCIATVVIHKAGYGLPTTGALDLLNLGAIFDLKKLMNQIEQLTKTSGINTSTSSNTPASPNSASSPTPNNNNNDQGPIYQKQQKTWKNLLSNALKLNEIISNSTLSNAPVGITSLFSITGETKEQTRRKLKSTQMFCILNATDIGCIDVLRRCRTIGIAKNSQTNSQIGFGGASRANSMQQFVSTDHHCL